VAVASSKNHFLTETGGKERRQCLPPGGLGVITNAGGDHESRRMAALVRPQKLCNFVFRKKHRRGEAGKRSVEYGEHWAALFEAGAPVVHGVLALLLKEFGMLEFRRWSGGLLRVYNSLLVISQNVS
jgi:hypothetical protein